VKPGEFAPKLYPLINQYVASAHFFQNIFRILNFSSDELLKRKLAIFEQAQADSA